MTVGFPTDVTLGCGGGWDNPPILGGVEGGDRDAAGAPMGRAE